MSRAFGGTGLGLSIARQLVRLIGGGMGIRSELGKGATFWFWVDLQTSSAASVEVKTLPNCRFNANILVAEDYPANQILVNAFWRGLAAKSIWQIMAWKPLQQCSNKRMTWY